MPIFLLKYAKFLPHIVALIAIVCGVWFYGHQRYQKGYDASEAVHLKAAVVAAEKYQAEVGRQQTVIADLNAKLEAERRRKNKVLTVYREATRNDPDCQAWAAAPIRCPLRLRDDADDHPAAPADTPGTTR